MDDFTQKILRELSRDGRMSNLDLSRKVGLSPSATLRRVQDLERRGVIAGYRVCLNPEMVGRGYVVYVAVGLSDHSKKAQEEFEQAMAKAPEVIECHNIAGIHEYLLRVETNGLAGYKHFHTEHLGTAPHVRSITSHMVMGTTKDERR